MADSDGNRNMHQPDQTVRGLIWVGIISLFSLLFHLLTYNNLGFHRDELLYLALGRHLDAGYWSNPPLIGLISYVSQQLPGDPLFNTRLVPALAGACLVFLTGLTARELGGRLYAQVLASLILSLSLIVLRGYSMLQPVPFDILFWSLILYWFLRYVNTERPGYLLGIGLGFGLGILNKYMVVFLAAGLVLGLLFTPYRKLWISRYTGLAVLIALLLFLPNLWWQYKHHFPVIQHMQELARTQLVNVNRFNIVIDQLLMFTFGSVIWVAGLVWVFFHANGGKYRVFGYTYLAVLLIFILLRGKSYYMAGLYPFFFAAGGVAWERVFRSATWRTAFAAVIALLSLPMVPAGIPVMKAPELERYFRDFPPESGIGALLRWEDGETHPLPQDYADMLGWDELGSVVAGTFDTLSGKSRVLIFAQNYGQAGAIDHFGQGQGLPATASFSDSYRLWIPDTLEEGKDILIYVNSELGRDIDSLFAHIEKVGGIRNPYAREYGTTVFLCREPRGDFRSFWAERVRSVKVSFHLQD